MILPHPTTPLSEQAQKTAYFGGTFNPIHKGHVAVAQAVLSQGLADMVAFLPSYAPPFKLNRHDLADYDTRCQWITHAIAGQPGLTLSRLEADLAPNDQGHITTAQVIRAIQAQQKNHEPVLWVAGQDALANLAQWGEPEFLVDHVHWLQAPRNGQPPVMDIVLNGQTRPLRTTLIEMLPINISSTDIRTRLTERIPLDNQVPNSITEELSS